MSSAAAWDPADAVAVVGMACRLPGAATPAAFWDLLTAGREALREPPPDRLGGDGTSPDGPPRGGFLDDVAGFDAAFFGVSPREAAAMDPQQRLLLELAWEALEEAWIVPDTLRASATGVFIGAMADDYAQLTHQLGEPTPHTLQGVQRGILANRLSHALDLRGPSLTVDTGQSSSLVAVHLACEALRRGEATCALAGGVNLMLAPGTQRATARFGALSPDGRCHTFDARANGYARGEGGVLVVLKPLARALADGDRVHCVVLGGAVVSDGGAEALTVPSREAQEEVLRLAYRRAGVAPAEVQYVELHGTGTRVGDPVEAAALGSVLGDARGDGPGRELRVGSAKTNVGHLEGAAGVVGLLKTALCLRHRRLVPSLNFTAPPPDIPLDRLGLRVQTETADWPHPDRPLVAGVSSFGMGGTNCHLVLAEAPGGADTTDGADRAATDGAPVPWLLSARSEAALRAQARSLRAHLRAHPELSPVDVGHTLATARSRHEHRAVVVGDGSQEALAALAALADGLPDARVVRGRVEAADGLAVLFSGQGSQRPGAGRALYAAHPVFAEAVDELCALFDAHLDRPLREVMFAEPGTGGVDGTDGGGDAAALLARTDYAQPALFTLQTALLRLFRSWGVRPTVLAGHSLGELTAAHAAGVLTTADAVTLVAARGRLMQRAAGGAMVAVEADEAEVRAALAELPGAVDVAAVNSPTSVVVSGDEAAVAQAEARFAAAGRRTRRLRVRHAFHSPHMDPLLAEFRDVAAGLTYRAPSLPVVSNVTGRAATAEELCSPDYWTRHLRATVRFADGVRTLGDQGVRAFLELGPDATLTTLAARCLPSAEEDDRPRPALTAALRPGRPEALAVLAAAGTLHTVGQAVDWRAVLGPGRRVDLPTYPFQRQRYWLPLRQTAPTTAPADPPAAPAAADAGVAAPAEPPAPAALHRLTRGTARQRRRAALELVRGEAAAVLGHSGPAGIDPHRSFRDAGFDSVTAVELRDRLRTLTGVELPATAVFERPTPAELADDLLTRLPAAEDASAAVAAVAALRAALAAGPPDDPAVAERLATELRELLSALPGAAAPPSPDLPGAVGARTDTDLTEQIGTASDDEIFALIDRECGDPSAERS